MDRALAFARLAEPMPVLALLEEEHPDLRSVDLVTRIQRVRTRLLSVGPGT